MEKILDEWELAYLIPIFKEHGITPDNITKLTESLIKELIPNIGKRIEFTGKWIKIAESSNHSDVEDVVLNQKEKALKRKISYGEVQPYLILVGQQLSEITTVYVVVDKILYKINSVLKAIDILFKIFITLDLKYPPPSEHIYLLIQRGIFKISCDTDKSIPYIEDILKYLLE